MTGVRRKVYSPYIDYILIHTIYQSICTFWLCICSFSIWAVLELPGLVWLCWRQNMHHHTERASFLLLLCHKLTLQWLNVNECFSSKADSRLNHNDADAMFQICVSEYQRTDLCPHQLSTYHALSLSHRVSFLHCHKQHFLWYICFTLSRHDCVYGLLYIRLHISHRYLW